MKNKIKDFEKIINYNFKKIELLQQALTHKSFNNIDNNEKLEFLGDRVLGLIISKKLLEIFPNDKEGVLDKKFASLVNRKKCFEISKMFNLENYLITGNIKSSKNKIEEKIVSDACEALIGAIYLDQGLNLADKFISKFWKTSLSKDMQNQIDSKTKLQEYSLKRFKKLPTYVLLKTSGPHHKPIFKVTATTPDSTKVYATGSSKKDAQQNAAKKLLKELGI